MNARCISLVIVTVLLLSAHSAWAFSTQEVICPPSALGAPFGVTTHGGICQVDLGTIPANAARQITVAVPATCFPRVVTHRVSAGPLLSDQAPVGVSVAIGGLSAIMVPGGEGAATDATVGFTVRNDAETPADAYLAFKWTCGTL